MEDKTKYKIISLLNNGQEPKHIADDLGVSYSSVLRIKNDLKEAQLNNDIQSLVDVDKLLIEQAAQELDIPTENVDKITNGLSGLDVLSDKLQSTALAILTKVNQQLQAADSITEVSLITNVIVELQTAFMNKNQTQVNVQNNFGENANQQSSRYSQFLGDKPGGA